jgi:hypothetical protein
MSLKRTPLKRKKPMKRTPMKRSAPKRIWDDARAKVEEEGKCRVCGIYDDATIDGTRVHIEAAHTIGREHDAVMVGPRGGEVIHVHPDSVIPLCSDDHRALHERRLDLLPYMTLEEQIEATRAAGGIYSAYERLSGNAD